MQRHHQLSVQQSLDGVPADVALRHALVANASIEELILIVKSRFPETTWDREPVHHWAMMSERPCKWQSGNTQVNDTFAWLTIMRRHGCTPEVLEQVMLAIIMENEGVRPLCFLRIPWFWVVVSADHFLAFARHHLHVHPQAFLDRCDRIGEVFGTELSHTIEREAQEALRTFAARYYERWP